MSNENVRAAAYARYSSDNQREESIEAQLRAIKEFAKKEGYNLVKIYIDEAKSATTDDRPNFLQMIEDSSKGMFDAVIVHKLDRFSRNRYDSAFYKRILKKNGVKLISVLEPLDDSPESIILESVLEGMAEYYSRNLAREVMKGMKETALQAKHTGGRPPLGYDIDKDGKYVTNQKEALVVKKIYDLFLQGYGYGKIAEELNYQGYRTKRGNLFTKNSIYEILINEKYKGTYVFNRRTSKKEGKRNNHKYKDTDEVIRISNALPAIIDEEVFHKVQEKISRRMRGPRMTGKRFYLLTGKIFCGECTSAYIGNGYRGGRNGKKYPIYMCGNRDRSGGCKNKSIRQDVIEKYVIDQLLNNIFSEHVIMDITKKILDYAQKYDIEKNEEINYLEQKRKDLSSKIERLIDAIEEGFGDKELISRRMKTYKEEMLQCENRVAELKATEYSWLDSEKIINYLKYCREALLSEDPKAKRKIIETFVDKIIIYPDRIDLSLKVDMKFETERGKVGGGEGNRTPVRRHIDKSLYRFIPCFGSRRFHSQGQD